MDLPRTPTKTQMFGGSASGGSTSNLSNFEDDEGRVNKDSRKRRPHTLEYDFKRDLAQFRSEIMGCIKEAMNEQFENITQMRNEIRQDIQDLKLTTDNLTEEYKKLHKSVENITTEHKVTQSKIIAIEDELHQLKSENRKPELSFGAQHEFFVEMQGRLQRDKNIILVGLNEQDVNDLSTGNNFDSQEAHKILTKAYQDCPTPLISTRLGKYNADKPRPIKI